MNTEKNETVTGTLFDCPICLERYRIPKSLPCLHTFCEQCIQSYIENFNVRKSTDGENFVQFIECPVCRRKAVASEHIKTPEDWVNELPLNYILVSLQGDQDNSDNVQSVLCEPCKRVSERKRAVFYCSNCDDRLCESCYTYLHRRIPQYVDHNVAYISKEKWCVSFDIKHCSIHENSELKYYCADHKELACSKCYDTFHCACEHVKSIDEVADNVEGCFSHIIRSIKKKTDSELQNTIKNLQHLENSRTNIQEKVINFIIDFKSKLDELHDKFLKNFEMLHDYEISCVQNKQRCLEKFVEILEKHEMMLAQVDKKGSPVDKFLTEEMVKTDVMKYLHDLDEDGKCHGDTTYQWKENSILKNLLDIEDIGNVQVIKKEKIDLVPGLRRDIELYQTKMNSPQANTLHIKNPECTQVVANYVTSYCVKCHGDENIPWVTNGIFLENGSLIIVDKHNSSIKEISSSGTTKVIYSKKSSAIRGICTTNADEKAFVSMDHTISEFSVSPHFKYERDFQTKNMEFYQIAFSKDYIFAHIGNPWCVKMIDRNNGRILKTLNGSSCGFGYFALSRDEKKIIYSKANSVVCEDVLSGEEFFQCAGTQTGIARKGARGIGVDYHDNIYVCNSKGGCIVMISKDGHFVKSILPILKEIKQPYALCFDKCGKKFFVSSYIESHCKIEVYEVQQQ